LTTDQKTFFIFIIVSFTAGGNKLAKINISSYKQRFLCQKVTKTG